VTTVLGGTSVHDGGPARSAFLCSPAGLAAGPDGTVYVADEWSHRVRAIDPRTGLIRTFAGTRAKAFGGDKNGSAASAWLGNPYDVAVDSRGRVAIAEKIHNFIRRVDEDGVIRIIAGSSFAHDRGDGGPAMGACFTRVQCVGYGPDDSLYIGDPVGRIRRIDAVSNTISTVAGTGISGYSGDGGPAVRARIGAPSAIRFDGEGNLYFTDSAYHVVRRVSREGAISTVAGCGKAGFSPDGARAAEAYFNKPLGLAVSPEGTVYVSDTMNHRVRRIVPGGELAAVAGSGTPGDLADGVLAGSARLNEPRGLLLYGDHLLICDSLNNQVRAIRVR